MIQKLFISIIALQKHGGEIFILVFEDIQYSGGISWNDSMWSSSLSKKSLTPRLDQSTGISDSRPSLLKAEVTDRVVCHVLVIFQTKKE